MKMTCAEFEILLCDYVDGAMDGAGREALEAHRRECAGCAALAADVAGAMAFMERAAAPDPPQELLTKIAFAIPSSRERPGWMMRWLRPVLQPKFAMGMAMTILSFSMLGRFAGIEVRQLRPSDLAPAKVWSALDDRMHRAWDRGVKYYESLRVVYEVQSRLQEWAEQEGEERKATEAPGDGGEGKNSR